MQHWQSRRPDHVHTFDYDAFVESPEDSVAALERFLGLPLAQSWRNFHLLGNTVKTASYWQVRRPLYRKPPDAGVITASSLSRCDRPCDHVASRCPTELAQP